jgi:hypothetical protein
MVIRFVRLYRVLTPSIIIVTCTFVSIVAFGALSLIATQSYSYLRVAAFGCFWCGNSVFFLGFLHVAEYRVAFGEARQYYSYLYLGPCMVE